MYLLFWITVKIALLICLQLDSQADRLLKLPESFAICINRSRKPLLLVRAGSLLSDFTQSFRCASALVVSSRSLGDLL